MTIEKIALENRFPVWCNETSYESFMTQANTKKIAAELKCSKSENAKINFTIERKIKLRYYFTNLVINKPFTKAPAIISLMNQKLRNVALNYT